MFSNQLNEIRSQTPQDGDIEGNNLKSGNKTGSKMREETPIDLLYQTSTQDQNHGIESVENPLNSATNMKESSGSSTSINVKIDNEKVGIFDSKTTQINVAYNKGKVRYDLNPSNENELSLVQTSVEVIENKEQEATKTEENQDLMIKLTDQIARTNHTYLG